MDKTRANLVRARAEERHARSTEMCELSAGLLRMTRCGLRAMLEQRKRALVALEETREKLHPVRSGLP